MFSVEICKLCALLRRYDFKSFSACISKIAALNFIFSKGIDLDNIHQAVLNILFDFYNKDVSQNEVKKFVTKNVITSQDKLNKAMFTAQLVAYSKAEGWEYLWLGVPNLGTYKVYVVDDIPKAVENGEIIINSKLGLGNVFRAKLN